MASDGDCVSLSKAAVLLVEESIEVKVGFIAHHDLLSKIENFFVEYIIVVVYYL